MCKVRQIRIEQNLKKLRALSSFNTGENVGNNMRILDVKKGYAVAKDIFPEGKSSISVAHTNAEPNTIFKEHYHNEKETISVFKGDLTVVIEDKEIKLTVGDCIEIVNQTPHWGYTEKGCDFIAQAIPASKGFPKDDRGIEDHI